jgi:hypothetical protein
MRTFLIVSAVAVLGLTASGCGGEGREAREPHHPVNNPPVELHSGAHPVSEAGEHKDDKNDKRVEAATGWEKLGERTVNGKADHDTIMVGKAEGRFKAIQIKVEHSALEMFDVRVTFGDDTTFSPPTRLVFHNGDISKVIDLPGDKRIIKKVDFNYGNLPGGGNAQVELWAK